jgi:hypothetical protein
MTTWRLSAKRLQGASRGSHPIVHVRARPRLVFFPADRINGPNFWLGTIYVVVAGQTVAHLVACGGPKEGGDDRGHSAGPTPAGQYVLGSKHHHVTPNWPSSCIPWGAAIRRAANGEVQFNDGSGWQMATGDGAPMNKALAKAQERANLEPYSPDELRTKARQAFAEDRKNAPNGALVPTWRRNDFGEWAFNLRENGKGTVYYIHTTPEDETATEAGVAFSLGQSHGCIHIRPEDRDRMVLSGYLAAGIDLRVEDYDAKGPP